MKMFIIDIMKRLIAMIVMAYGTASFVVFVLAVSYIEKDPDAPWFVIGGLLGMIFTYKVIDCEQLY